jgi:hypothetical protein
MRDLRGMTTEPKRRAKEPKGEQKPPPTSDVESVRAKASGHRKKTADKWNQ